MGRLLLRDLWMMKLTALITHLFTMDSDLFRVSSQDAVVDVMKENDQGCNV